MKASHLDASNSFETFHCVNICSCIMSEREMKVFFIVVKHQKERKKGKGTMATEESMTLPFPSAQELESLTLPPELEEPGALSLEEISPTLGEPPFAAAPFPPQAVEPEIDRVLRECSAADDFTQSIFPHQRRIIALGDTHGDLEALVICLRDLAQVMRPREDDPDEFEWIGRDTFVVLCGDMLDRYRPNVFADPVTHFSQGESTDDEYDMLMLLNKLNVQALAVGGRVIKVLGNHEIFNLSGQFDYVTPRVRAERAEQMRPPAGQMFRALFGCGIYGICQIGDWIFCHGGVIASLVNDVAPVSTEAGAYPFRNADYNFIDRVNEVVREWSAARGGPQATFGEWGGWNALFGEPTLSLSAPLWMPSSPSSLAFPTMASPRRTRHASHTVRPEDVDRLWNRIFVPRSVGLAARKDDALVWNDEFSNPDQATDCDRLMQQIASLGYNVHENTRLVVGHSIQTWRGLQPVPGASNPNYYTAYVYPYVNHELSDDKRLVFEGPAARRTFDIQGNQMFPFGINFDCPIVEPEVQLPVRETERVGMKRPLSSLLASAPSMPFAPSRPSIPTMPTVLPMPSIPTTPFAPSAPSGPSGSLTPEQSAAAWAKYLGEEKKAPAPPRIMDGRVWRLDVGMSRSFDTLHNFQTMATRPPMTQRVLYARRPQVLEINWNTDTQTYFNRVIVSRRGLPRTIFTQVLDPDLLNEDQLAKVF